jgi:hypothetical protein
MQPLTDFYGADMANTLLTSFDAVSGQLDADS